MSQVIKRLLWAFAVLLVLAFLGLAWPLELVALMTFGWVLYLRRVMPQVAIDWPTIAMSIAALVIFAAGLHQLCKWLYRNIHRESAEDSNLEPPLISGERHWWPRWTIGIVSILVLMFVVGIAITGIVHQATWIARSPEPLFESGGARQMARRNQSLNNLKQMAIGSRQYGEARNAALPGGTENVSGRRTHGWQALLLQFIEWQQLYDRIDFDKPWDHPENQDAYHERVDVYERPGAAGDVADENGYPFSDYAANVHVVGPNSVAEFSDGAANTLLFGEVRDNRTPWGYPANWRDPALGINRHPRGFGATWSSRVVNFAMADGSVQFINDDIDPSVLRALATPNGGEAVDQNSIDER